MKNPEKNNASILSLAPLLISSVLVWLTLAYPAFYMAGKLGLEGLTLSAFLCLVPGWLAFWFVSRYGDASNFVMASFAGTAVRMFFVLAAVLVIKKTGRYPKDIDFVIWVILFFLATLAVETFLLVKHINSTEEPVEQQLLEQQELDTENKP